jgi:hypothetical protein
MYRPDCLDDISFYEFAGSYDRISLSFYRMNKVEQSDMPILNDSKL